MKIICASLLCLAIFTAGLCALGHHPFGQVSAQTENGMQQRQATNEDAPITNGATLVAQAAHQVSGATSLSANLRYQIHLYGQQMVGRGTYHQLGNQEEKQLRLELVLQVGQQSSSLLQVCNGRFLWVHRVLPRRTELSRIDLDRVRLAVEEQEHPGNANAASWLAWGGIAKLMEGMARNFEFAPPVGREHQELEVWKVEGRWRLDRLEQLLPGSEPLTSHRQLGQIDLPPHLPERVRLYIGRDDLFPYRIEYLRRAESTDEEAPTFEPIVVIEFFSVQMGIELDPLMFGYQPGDIEVTDDTEPFIRALGVDP